MSEYLTYKIVKAGLIILAVVLVCFFYTLFTGKRLTDKFRERPRKDQ